VAQKRKSGFQISYVTITYRSVFMGLLGILVLAGIVTYFAFPDTANKLILSGQGGLGKALVKLGITTNPGGATQEPGPQQAHFTNIDGTVRVRKAATNTWVVADYSLALERGDVVQTAAEGIAKVVFTDGTNYTVKPDSLIVIQENSVNAAQQTRVAVQVTTGTVDLATTTLVSGSKSQVIVAGATASIASETTAQVINDPRGDQHEIMVKKGSGEVTREGQTVNLEDYTKVTFNNDSKNLAKTKEITPPVLINPKDKESLALGQGPNGKGVSFTWSPVDNVQAYHLQIAANAFFSPLVVDDKRVTSTQVVVTDLAEGTYYWQVRSIGENGKESVESERDKFTIIHKSADKGSIALEVGDFVQHGHVIEVRGRTEQSARVMVNGQEAVVSTDGTFHHFTNPLPTGENVITVTAQNAKGGFNNISRPINIQ